MNELMPVIKADFPDPDVIRVDDTYYMLCSTLHFLPGAVILRSYDLVNWEIASYVFDTFEGTEEARMTNEHNNYGCGMWAGSLRYHMSALLQKKPVRLTFTGRMILTVHGKEPVLIFTFITGLFSLMRTGKSI